MENMSLFDLKSQEPPSTPPIPKNSVIPAMQQNYALFAFYASQNIILLTFQCI